jgi:hypothetical protein
MKYLIVLTLGITSCATLTLSGGEKFAGHFKTTKITNTDTTCYEQKTKVAWQTNLKEGTRSFVYIAEDLTLDLELYPVAGPVFSGLDELGNEFYIVFATALERREGFLLIIEEKNTPKPSLRVIGNRCVEF